MCGQKYENFTGFNTLEDRVYLDDRSKVIKWYFYESLIYVRNYKWSKSKYHTDKISLNSRNDAIFEP